MSTYEIVKSAPLPPVKVQHRRFPFAEMEVGDSFFVPLTDIKETAARVQCSKWSHKLGRRFRVRNYDNVVAQFWRES